jgi:hypothetical protein
MLVEQAAEAFVWWRGVRPATKAIIEQITIPFSEAIGLAVWPQSDGFAVA